MLSKNQIKEIQSLHLKKQRDLRQLFIAEGLKTIRDIISAQPALIQSIYGTSEFINSNKSLFQDQKIVIVEITEDELKKISLQASPNQALAVCHYIQQKSSIKDNGFSFFLDDIRDPGNFGTILRLADWYGMGTVYCSTQSCDLYNPKAIQSTMGAFLRVQVIYSPIEKVAAEFPVVYGAVLNGNNIYTQQLKVGLIVIGNEANGIGTEALNLLTHQITIPSALNSGMESLNAAMAASIIASEFFRQLH